MGISSTKNSLNIIGTNGVLMTLENSASCFYWLLCLCEVRTKKVVKLVNEFVQE